MKHLFAATLTAVLFSGILSAVEARIADADGDGINDRRARQHRLNLTDEQRAEIRETKRGLREQGATRVEIVTAVGENFKVWEWNFPKTSKSGMPQNSNAP